jgi:choline dehydrogenase
VQHLPGVGQNLQDHVGFDCVWESHEPLSPRNNFVEATYFWKSDPKLDAPDLQVCHGEFLKATPENVARFQPPANGWILVSGTLMQLLARFENINGNMQKAAVR